MKVGIRHFKIQGRDSVLAGEALKSLTYYFNENFNGNLLNLINLFTLSESERYIDNKKLDGFVEKFFHDSDLCKDNCDSCGYCAEYARKSMNIKRTENINKLVKQTVGKKLNGLLEELRDV